MCARRAPSCEKWEAKAEPDVVSYSVGIWASRCVKREAKLESNVISHSAGIGMAWGSAGGLISYSAGIISSEKGGADLCAGGAEGTARRYLGVGPQPAPIAGRIS